MFPPPMGGSKLETLHGEPKKEEPLGGFKDGRAPIAELRFCRWRRKRKPTFPPTRRCARACASCFDRGDREATPKLRRARVGAPIARVGPSFGSALSDTTRPYDAQLDATNLHGAAAGRAAPDERSLHRAEVRRSEPEKTVRLASTIAFGGSCSGSRRTQRARRCTPQSRRRARIARAPRGARRAAPR